MGTEGKFRVGIKKTWGRTGGRSRKMKDDKPLVSIITPSYNQEEFIEDTILSVKNQDYPNIEHIIVDGGSTDNTLEILRKYEREYNLMWISEPDKGQSDGVNKGLKMAKGEIIGWLNSDDLYFDKQVVSCVVREFTESGDVDLIHGNNIIINQNNLILQVVHHASQISHGKILRLSYISQPSTFIRKASLGNVELDVELHYAMDYELWIRLLEKGLKFKHINRIVACHKQHASMKSFELRSVSAEARLVQVQHGRTFGPRERVLTWWDLGRRASLRIKGIPTMVNIYLHRDRYDFAFNPKFDSIFKVLLRQIAYRELVQLGIIRYKVQ